MSRDGVQVLSILGRNYSIRVPAGEERALADAAALLQAEVDANKRKFPYVTSNELVVLSALNLCARQLGANDGESPRLRAVEQRLEALVERIAGASS
ncbi:cell division protein ZapA [Pseudomonas aeruginosa]|uniref:cell division protein ZapA n=1 Tax=Pseudomonas aeruginosa TaxID=287 RepID=UPI000F52E559|nr:cell division protein ZapA [Pseudomonas aeruginosa]EIU5497553.1 cell division protein ZapA [Pseudomonas aeruginosa]MBG5258658.1 cell division protein ZapA [Pseudomonas aeruginosa]MBG5396397.1 cell division protein ZapA [Pseudomonas aeruginosa]MBI7143974.1 cell division protein ZapA [Pseudomonas aeruginosa]MDP5593542.1 cell division protein ZapA [Pseudomonas aeruginosa]